MGHTFATYDKVGHRFVNGYMEPQVLYILSILDAAQRARGITGAVAEIGVHRGKLFVGLSLLQRAGERSVAIDIFEDQELNIDNSGRGNLRRFRYNLRLWSSMEGVVTHQGDSTKLTAEALREKAGAPIRLFSVDGGHTEEIVLSDMRLAEATLADGGVVVADDVFNEAWPGVATGTLQYLASDAELVPFAVGFNKVFFTQREHSARYLTELDTALARRPQRLQRRSSTFAGHPVLVLKWRTVVDIVRRNPEAQEFWNRKFQETRGVLQRRFGAGK